MMFCCVNNSPFIYFFTIFWRPFRSICTFKKHPNPTTRCERKERFHISDSKEINGTMALYGRGFILSSCMVRSTMRSLVDLLDGRILTTFWCRFCTQYVCKIERFSSHHPNSDKFTLYSCCWSRIWTWKRAMRFTPEREAINLPHVRYTREIIIFLPWWFLWSAQRWLLFPGSEWFFSRSFRSF